MSTQAHLALVLTTCLAAPPSMSTDRDEASLEIHAGSVRLTVDDPRPIASAVRALVDRYGRVITYEDPRYAHADDLEDITDRVRNDLHLYPPGEAPRVIGPRGGTLTVFSPSENLEEILRELLLVQSAANRGGRFRVEHAEDAHHVTPTHVRHEDGRWLPQRSVLDVSVSLPLAERSADELLRAIYEAIGTASGARLIPGMACFDCGPRNPGEGAQRYLFGAEHEPARRVLMRALALISQGRERYTWLIYYGDDSHVVNLLPVPRRPD